MTVITCDRCNKDITNDKEKWHLVHNQECEFIDKHLDLCPTCYNEFKNFLRNPENSWLRI